MKLTHYGRDVIFRVLFISIILLVSSLIIPVIIIKYILFFISLFLISFTLYFFRDPEREIPDTSKGKVISPADGKVVLIEEYRNGDNLFFEAGEELVQLSIFLSPLNVHVNRIPLGGTVKYLKYIKGEYLVAFDHKSSERNERSEIGIEDGEGRKIFFKQIAGFVARRIVYDIKEGDIVKAGSRFGMIKFGSRMDIICKKGVKFLVKPGDIVKGGETVIADL